MEDFYQLVIASIRDSVREATNKELSGLTDCVLLGTNAVSLQKIVTERIRLFSADCSFILVGQEAMIEKAKEQSVDFADAHLWEGRYSDELVDVIRSAYPEKRFDSLVFFSREPIAIKSLNLYRIGVLFQKYFTAGIYAFDHQGILWRYENVGMMVDSLSLFRDMNAYLIRSYDHGGDR